MQKALEIGHALCDFVGRRWHKVGVSGPGASYPVLRAPKLTGGQVAAPAPAQQVTLVLSKGYDPNGFPRPGNNHTNVPLRTTFYIELEGPDDNADPINPTSVTLSLTRAGGTVNILGADEQFQPGCSGWIVPRGEGSTALVYADSAVPLLPST